MTDKKLAAELQRRANKAAKKLGKAKARGDFMKIARWAIEMQTFEVAASIVRGELSAFDES